MAILDDSDPDLNTLLEKVKRWKRRGFTPEFTKGARDGYCYAVKRIKLGKVRDEWKPLIKKIADETPVEEDITAILEVRDFNLQRLYNMDQKLDVILKEVKELKLLHKLVEGAGSLSAGSKVAGEVEAETSLPAGSSVVEEHVVKQVIYSEVFSNEVEITVLPSITPGETSPSAGANVVEKPITTTPPGLSTPPFMQVVAESKAPTTPPAPYTTGFGDLPVEVRSVLFELDRKSYIILKKEEPGFTVNPLLERALKAGLKLQLAEKLACGERSRGVECRAGDSIYYRILDVIEKVGLKGEKVVYYRDLQPLAEKSSSLLLGQLEKADSSVIQAPATPRISGEVVGEKNPTSPAPAQVVVDFNKLPLSLQNALAEMSSNDWIDAGDYDCNLTGWSAWDLIRASNPLEKIREKCRRVLDKYKHGEVEACITTLTLLYEKLKTQYNLEELKEKSVKELNTLLLQNPITLPYNEILEKLGMV